MMTRETYRAVAEALRAARPDPEEALQPAGQVENGAIDRASYLFADTAYRDNPRFNRDLFLRACGTTHPNGD